MSPVSVTQRGVKRGNDFDSHSYSKHDPVKHARVQKPRERLEEVVSDLIKHKAEDVFPQLCLDAFDREIFNLIEKNSVKGSFVIPKMISAGKSLVMIISLAVRCKNNGIDHLQNARRQIEADRFVVTRAPTKHWFGFVAEDKVNEVETSTWETIKASIQQQQSVEDDTGSIASLSYDDVTGGSDDIHSLPDNVVDCFRQRHSLEPFNAEDLDNLFCDSCKLKPEEVAFESCEQCGLIFCEFCSDRWNNFA